jgi:hypothetical protein
MKVVRRSYRVLDLDRLCGRLQSQSLVEVRKDGKAAPGD